jgi:hypothetical protein
MDRRAVEAAGGSDVLDGGRRVVGEDATGGLDDRVGVADGVGTPAAADRCDV